MRNTGNILQEPVCFVDIETTGLNYVNGRVIEVGVVRVENGQVVRTFNQLIDPEAPLPYFITKLTGISDGDLADAPTFHQIVDELHDILDGALFVAHNVRFDYSFLKAEFKRTGRDFTPKQLCTVKLSRALYPEHRTHKLADVIERHNIQVSARHRAYDDAAVLWEFLQIVQRNFAAEVVTAALGKQIKQPAMPKGLDPAFVNALPDGHGVYVFEDEAGRALYIGKSVHVRTRVRSHFGADHEHISEFKIAQHIRNIRVHETVGELASLLLESRLIKELQPVYNKKLRKTEKLTLARHIPDEQGYLQVVLEEANGIDPDSLETLLAVYTHRGKAREALEVLAKEHVLCPKLLGLEKSKAACFLRQLRKCRGACEGAEPAALYNERLLAAFERKRVDDWPYASPILVTEVGANETVSGVVIDRWCIVGHVTQEAHCSPVFTAMQRAFDLDTYKILRAQLASKSQALKITPVSTAEITSFGV